jgi:Tripartite tricarboxylate transporter family receptor
VAVHAANDLRELIEVAKEEPRKVNYRSITIGPTRHLTTDFGASAPASKRSTFGFAPRRRW